MRMRIVWGQGFSQLPAYTPVIHKLDDVSDTAHSLVLRGMSVLGASHRVLRLIHMLNRQPWGHDAPLADETPR